MKNYADLRPLKTLVLEHPTTSVVECCRDLQLVPYIHRVNVSLSTMGGINPKRVDLVETYLPLAHHVWNALAACRDSEPCPFNIALVDEHLSLASGISEDEGRITFEPTLLIDPVSLAPLQLTGLQMLQLKQELVQRTMKSEKLHQCMQALAAAGWIKPISPPHEYTWQWLETNNHAIATCNLFYQQGLIVSKQDFLKICLSQNGTPLNTKSTTVPATSDADSVVENLLNSILSA